MIFMSITCALIMTSFTNVFFLQFSKLRKSSRDVSAQNKFPDDICYLFIPSTLHVKDTPSIYPRLISCHVTCN